MDPYTDTAGLIRLDEDQCWDFLSRQFLGRVAVVHMDHPAVFPVNYVLDGRSVVFRTAPGTKLAMAAAGQNAAFEVDEVTGLFETGTSVVVHGKLEEVTDPGEIERLERLPLRTWAEGQDHFVRVRPTWTSGRRIPIHHFDDGLGADAG